MTVLVGVWVRQWSEFEEEVVVDCIVKKFYHLFKLFSQLVHVSSNVL